MRIPAQSQLAAGLSQVRGGNVGVRRAVSPASSSTQPIRPLPTTSVNPFASLFRTFSKTVGAPIPTTVAPPAAASSQAAASTAATATSGTSTTGTGSTSAASTPPPQTPGVSALVNAMIKGTFQATYVTDPGKLQETNPQGTDQMPNFYYASDDTANQLAQLLGGKVVQLQPFSTAPGWSEPKANFIQLPSGQTVNAAGLAYYARVSYMGAAQLTADLTQAINQGAAWTNYYQNGGPPPSFPLGYVGPPIAGMDYPSNLIGSDGMVINPAMGA